MAEPIYSTYAALRTELELDNVALPDASALRLIMRAEDHIDDWLPGYQILTTGASTGRKIAQASIEAYQWTNLQRATTLLAAELHRTPGILQAQEWDTVSGPDFSASGHKGVVTRGRLGEVASILNASGLRIRGARARA